MDTDDLAGSTARIAGSTASVAEASYRPQAVGDTTPGEHTRATGAGDTAPGDRIEQMLMNYTVTDLKDGLRSKGLAVTGLKADLVKRLAGARDLPPDSLLNYVAEVMNEQNEKPQIRAILTVQASMAWLTAARTTTRGG